MSSLSFNKEKIIEFINQCNSDNLDLSGYEFIDPIYWVILKTLKSGLKPDLTIRVDKDSPTYSYAQYLFGIEDKKAKTTVPIRVIQNRGEVERFVNELLDATQLDFEDWQDRNCFKYPLIELINNAIDHGKSPAIACAQRFPTLNEMEITVSDYGLGFLRTISSKHPEVNTYAAAIKKALEKGVTGSQVVMYGSVTKNLGMGLYVISKMIHRVGGDMFVVSGDSFYSLKNDKVNKLTTGWQGSIVTLRFNLDKFQQNIVSYGFTFIRELLVEDNDEGEDIF